MRFSGEVYRGCKANRMRRSLAAHGGGGLEPSTSIEAISADGGRALNDDDNDSDDEIPTPKHGSKECGPIQQCDRTEFEGTTGTMTARFFLARLSANCCFFLFPSMRARAPRQAAEMDEEEEGEAKTSPPPPVLWGEHPRPPAPTSVKADERSNVAICIWQK